MGEDGDRNGGGVGFACVCVCAGGGSDQTRCEPSSIDTRAAVKKTEGGSEDEEEEGREGGTYPGRG